MSLDIIIDINKVNIFQGDNLILSDVTFSLCRGEFVYIIGKVGSGKTSIIKTINAELPLRSGDAIIAGYNLAEIRNAILMTKSNNYWSLRYLIVSLK
jgi:cell division transport system ATP-binding protein